MVLLMGIFSLLVRLCVVSWCVFVLVVLLVGSELLWKVLVNLVGFGFMSVCRVFSMWFGFIVGSGWKLKCILVVGVIMLVLMLFLM